MTSRSQSVSSGSILSMLFCSWVTAVLSWALVGGLTLQDLVHLSVVIVEFVLELMQVIIEREVFGVAVVAVQVNEGLKTLFRALEHPVNRTLFVIL